MITAMLNPLFWLGVAAFGWLATEAVRRLYSYKLHAFTVNYLKRGDSGPARWWRVVDVGFFVYHLPRLIVACRLFGHRPVVDGTGPTRSGNYLSQSYMWVCCDRCGVRGEPQGSLDPTIHQIGMRYRGPWDERTPGDHENIGRAYKLGEQTRPLLEPPGRIERRPTGKIGGQLVIGGGWPGWDAEFKVGNCGSEHTLAATFRAGRLGALFLHTEAFGTGLQRRLNPVGYQSKVSGLHIGGGRGIEWRLWTPRDDSRPVYPATASWRWLTDRVTGRHNTRPARRGDMQVGPWWRHGAVRFNILDNLLGPRQYSYTQIGDKVPRIVRLPEGDYLVALQLERRRGGRRRAWLRHPKWSWDVEWRAMGKGLPIEAGDTWKGPIMGASVTVADQAVREGTWAAEACALIALDITRMRTSKGWEPVGRLSVTEGGAIEI